MSDNVLPLTRYDAMRQAIVQAHSIDEVKDIRDKAEALRAYARQSKQGIDHINRVTEIKLRAERRAGELLQEMEKAKGGQPYQEKSTGCTMQPVEKKVSTLADVGIEKTQAMRWQQIAKLPEELFEAHIGQVVSEGKELTTNGLLSRVHEHQRTEKYAAMQAPAYWPTGQYRVILADPPWQYERNEAGVTDTGGALLW